MSTLDVRELYVAYAPQLREFVERQLLRTSNGYSCRPSEDLVQDVFLRLLLMKQAASVHNLDGLGKYLRAIARNLYLDELRRERRSPIVRAESDVDFPEPDTSDPSQGEAHELRMRLASLFEYVDTLPESVRTVYQLRFERGLSQADTAAALFTTRRAVRTLESRLRTGALAALGPEAESHLENH